MGKLKDDDLYYRDDESNMTSNNCLRNEEVMCPYENLYHRQEYLDEHRDDFDTNTSNSNEDGEFRYGDY